MGKMVLRMYTAAKQHIRAPVVMATSRMVPTIHKAVRPRLPPPFFRLLRCWEEERRPESG